MKKKTLIAENVTVVLTFRIQSKWAVVSTTAFQLCVLASYLLKAHLWAGYCRGWFRIEVKVLLWKLLPMVARVQDRSWTRLRASIDTQHGSPPPRSLLTGFEWQQHEPMALAALSQACETRKRRREDLQTGAALDQYRTFFTLMHRMR